MSNHWRENCGIIQVSLFVCSLHLITLCAGCILLFWVFLVHSSVERHLYSGCHTVNSSSSHPLPVVSQFLQQVMGPALM